MPAPLSVVVPTRDRPERLDSCLAALAAAVRAGDEVVVVDSASADAGAVAAVAERHGARLVRCERPGASRARNAGVAAATHPLIAFVDDDVTVGPGWADALATALAVPAVAFVTGRTSVPEDQSDRQRVVAVKDDDLPARLDATSPSPLGSSANLGVTREALERVGGFDEALGGGARFQAAEDVDLFDRLLAAGFTGRYEPGALGWHHQWRSRRQLVQLDWRYGLGAGARMAKLVRHDARRARRALVDTAWDDGLVVLGRAVREWQEFLIATTAVRLAGMVVGFAWAIATPVRDGRYR